jgi:hypothetical protein
MVASRTGVVPIQEYERVKLMNKQLLQDNTDLKIQVSHLQKQLSLLKEASFNVN